MAQEFPCGKCGAKLKFTPGVQALKCSYCGHENSIPQSEDDIEELDFRAQLDGLERGEAQIEQTTIKCGSCAAESTLDPNVTSTECPFCGTPLVAQSESKRIVKPKSLLPFKVTRDEGRKQYQQWVRSRWFAPGKFKKYASLVQQLHGIYYPHWTYDTDTVSYYHGSRGEYYWVTVGSGKNRSRVRRTRWWPASGTVWESFDDVLIPASRSLPQKYVERLEPWDLPSLTPYADEYLSGFRTESYQVGLAAGFELAQPIMDDTIRARVRADIGGDTQRITSIKTRYDNIRFKHILLPIWLSTYRYSNKPYRFLVNARTGEVQGERPWSVWKIVLFVLMILAIIAAIGVGIAMQR